MYIYNKTKSTKLRRSRSVQFFLERHFCNPIGKSFGLQINGVGPHSPIYFLSTIFHDLKHTKQKQIREAKDDNGAGDIWGTTVRNKEELKILWESIVWGITRGGCETYAISSVFLVNAGP